MEGTKKDEKTPVFTSIKDILEDENYGYQNENSLCFWQKEDAGVCQRNQSKTPACVQRG